MYYVNSSDSVDGGGKDDNGTALFTGDCLFVGGCGRFFEGSPKEMSEALKPLLALPEKTQVFCGHEYTVAKLKVGPDSVATICVVLIVPFSLLPR